MANFGPVPNLLIWKFNKRFLHTPQARKTVFAHMVMTEMLSGQQQYNEIFPQVDGIDYNPESTDLRQAETPMFDFTTQRTGYRKIGHVWGHPIATEDFHRTQPGYRGTLADLCATAIARFKDRVLLSKAADGVRKVTTGATNIGTPTDEALPAANRYAILDTSTTSATTLQSLDLATLQHANLWFKNRWSDEGSNCCVASPSQIQGLLNDDKIVNHDYNTVRALTNGEVDGFMGFKFKHSKAGGSISSSDDVYFRNGMRDVRIAAATNYAKLGSNVNAERILFCNPAKAFTLGMLPQAGYTNVWQNPNRMGTWEYFRKEVIGFRRTQNEYVLQVYAKSPSDSGTAFRQNPIKADKYFDNYEADGSSWTYTQALNT